MKKIVSTLLLSLAALTAVHADDPVNVIKDPAQLPEKAQAFLNDYFPGQTPVKMLVEKDDLIDRDYEVTMPNDIKVEFDRKGEWTKVENKAYMVPSTIVPKDITKFVVAAYPETDIVSIEKEDRGYEVKLSSGKEVHFNASGKYLYTESD